MKIKEKSGPEPVVASYVDPEFKEYTKETVEEQPEISQIISETTEDLVEDLSEDALLPNKAGWPYSEGGAKMTFSEYGFHKKILEVLDRFKVTHPFEIQASSH